MDKGRITRAGGFKSNSKYMKLKLISYASGLMAWLIAGCASPNKTYPGMVEVDPIVTVYGPGGKLLRGPRSKAPKKSWAFTWTGWTPEEKAAWQGGMAPALMGMAAANAQAAAAAPAVGAATYNALQTQTQMQQMNGSLNQINNTLRQQNSGGGYGTHYRGPSW